MPSRLSGRQSGWARDKFGDELTVAEIEFLREHEWAETVSDIIWRRTKLGYVLDTSQKQAISAYLDSKS